MQLVFVVKLRQIMGPVFRRVLRRAVVGLVLVDDVVVVLVVLFVLVVHNRFE